MAGPVELDGCFNERILEGLRPNFFELLSQEAMHDALRPAIQYFIKVSGFIANLDYDMMTVVGQIAAQSRPDWLGVLWRGADEVYFLFELLLQIHFIRKHSE